MLIYSNIFIYMPTQFSAPNILAYFYIGFISLMHVLYILRYRCASMWCIS